MSKAIRERKKGRWDALSKEITGANKTGAIPIIILCLGTPAWISSWTTAPKLWHISSIESKCSGQSGEIL